MVLIRSLELLQGSDKVSLGPATTYSLTQYANLLAAQGSLAIAMSFLPSDCTQVRVAMIKPHLLIPSSNTARSCLGTVLTPQPGEIRFLRQLAVWWEGSGQ